MLMALLVMLEAFLDCNSKLIQELPSPTAWCPLDVPKVTPGGLVRRYCEYKTSVWCIAMPLSAGQVGSIFEYFNRHAIFGVLPPDNILWAPILGFFAITGLPSSGLSLAVRRIASDSMLVSAGHLNSTAPDSVADWRCFHALVISSPDLNECGQT